MYRLPNDLAYLARLALAHDGGATADHSRRVCDYSLGLAKRLGLGHEQYDRLRWAAEFHDIGKIGLPIGLLNKAGRLAPEELARLKQHPGFGAFLLGVADPHIPRETLDAVESHHERFDGQGYPNGMRGQDIPLLARIIAVADVFDALTSRRAYHLQGPLTAEESLEYLQVHAGGHFDPAMVAAFTTIQKSPAEKRFKLPEVNRPKYTSRDETTNRKP